jgi:hypothetical protein
MLGKKNFFQKNKHFYETAREVFAENNIFSETKYRSFLLLAKTKTSILF